MLKSEESHTALFNTLNEMLAQGRAWRAAKGELWRKRGAVLAAIVFPLVIGLFTEIWTNVFAMLFFAIVGGVLGGILGRAIGRELIPDIEYEMESLFADHVFKLANVTFLRNAFESEEFDECRSLSVLPSYDRADVYHLVRDAGFWSLGAHLEEERTVTETDKDGKIETRTEWVTVFHGRVHSVPVPSRIRDSGEIYVLPRGQGAGLPKISFASPDMMRRWNVYADNGTMAHFVLDGPMIERLCAASFEGGQPCLFFTNERLYFTQPTHSEISFACVEETYTDKSIEAVLYRLGESKRVWDVLWPNESFETACEQSASISGED